MNEFQIEEKNPYYVFRQKIDAETLLSLDTFRLSERDCMTLSSILLETLTKGSFSETDFYNDKAFNCLLILTSKVNSKIR